MKRDGWHNIGGYEVYMEAGYILRGILGTGNQQKTAYIYRRNKDGSWTKEEKLTVAAFYGGLARETIKLM